MDVLTVKGLEVKYDHMVALTQVDFQVGKGEFIGIIGPNGGGKTTLVKTILGILEPSKGSVIIEAGEILGYVPQLITFDRHFPITVEEVILTGHLPKKIKLGYKLKEHYNHAQQVMEQLGILDLEKRQIGQLSGGQMQKVLVARALMNHPTILVLDEPTAGVDEASTEGIYEMLKDLNNYITILMISHDTKKLNHYIDRLFYINKTAHIHSVVPDVEDVSYGDNCPIDWYLKGEKIQSESLLV